MTSYREPGSSRRPTVTDVQPPGVGDSVGLRPASASGPQRAAPPRRRCPRPASPTPLAELRVCGHRAGTLGPPGPRTALTRGPLLGGSRRGCWLHRGWREGDTGSHLCHSIVGTPSATYVTPAVQEHLTAHACLGAGAPRRHERLEARPRGPLWVCLPTTDVGRAQKPVPPVGPAAEHRSPPAAGCWAFGHQRQAGPCPQSPLPPAGPCLISPDPCSA